MAPKFFFQDAKFLSKYMPQLMSHLHYRIVDVSTIKEIAKRWYPDVAVIQLQILKLLKKSEGPKKDTIQTGRPNKQKPYDQIFSTIETKIQKKDDRIIIYQIFN